MSFNIRQGYPLQPEKDKSIPTPEQIDAAYRKVWSTVPHGQRLTAFANEIVRTFSTSDSEDAARWRFIADYLVGSRTEFDDAIVACINVNDLCTVIDTARKQGDSNG